MMRVSSETASKQRTGSLSFRTRSIVKVFLVCCIIVIIVSLYILGKNDTTGLYSGLSFQKMSLSGSNYHNHEVILSNYSKDNYLFHTGKDSIGGDLIHVRGSSIDQLKELCQQTEGCVGFTTDGHLKHVIQPYNEWTAMEDKRQGLYTLDTNYCDLHEGHNCPAGITCLNKTNGTYTCKSIIHIGMSIDSKVIDGVIAVIQSLIDHSSKNQIIIHIITNTTDKKIVKDRVDCSLNLPPSISIDHKTFDVPDSLRNLIMVTNPRAKYLANAANYARFYLAKMFPHLSYLIYLDADLIVKKDIGLVWKEVVNTDKLLVVVPRGHSRCTLNHTKLAKPYYNRNHKDFNFKTCSGFNAGVFGVNLKMWRDNNVLEEVLYWMKMNKKLNIWNLGTQPIMYIIENENWKGIEGKWNLHDIKRGAWKFSQLRSSYIVHWSGPDKPWGNRPKKTKSDRLVRKFDNVWDKYKRNQCSNRGVCRKDDSNKKSAYCVCNNGYTGRLCDKKSK